MEKLGREPDPDKAPPEEWQFPLEVQEAFLIHSILTDKWDGANGSYLGKDWSALSTHFNTFKIEDRKIITYFLKIIDQFYTKYTNENLEKKRKAREIKTPSGTQVPTNISKNYGKK
tara:strand:+ start:917 stop:1264 length:348 start_codon:yes stop_codon:yes gene_type:complete